MGDRGRVRGSFEIATPFPGDRGWDEAPAEACAAGKTAHGDPELGGAGESVPGLAEPVGPGLDTTPPFDILRALPAAGPDACPTRTPVGGYEYARGPPRRRRITAHQRKSRGRTGFYADLEGSSGAVTGPERSLDAAASFEHHLRARVRVPGAGPSPLGHDRAIRRFDTSHEHTWPTPSMVLLAVELAERER